MIIVMVVALMLGYVDATVHELPVKHVSQQIGIRYDTLQQL